MPWRDEQTTDSVSVHYDTDKEYPNIEIHWATIWLNS